MGVNSFIPDTPGYSFRKKRSDLRLAYDLLAQRLEPEKRALLPQQPSPRKKTKPRQYSGSSACKAQLVDLFDWLSQAMKGRNPDLEERQIWVGPLATPDLEIELQNDFCADVIQQCIREMLAEGEWTDVEGTYGEKGVVYKGTLLRKPAGVNTFVYQLHYPVIRAMLGTLPAKSPFDRKSPLRKKRKRKPKEQSEANVTRLIGEQSSPDKSGNLAEVLHDKSGNNGEMLHDKSGNFPGLLPDKSGTVPIGESRDSNYLETTPTETNGQAPAGAVVDLISLYPAFLNTEALKTWKLPSVFDPAQEEPGASPSWNLALIRATLASFAPMPIWHKGDKKKWADAEQDIYRDSFWRLAGVFQLARFMIYQQDRQSSAWAVWMDQQHPGWTLHAHNLLDQKKWIDEMNGSNYQCPQMLTWQASELESYDEEGKNDEGKSVVSSPSPSDEAPCEESSSHTVSQQDLEQGSESLPVTPVPVLPVIPTTEMPESMDTKDATPQNAEKWVELRAMLDKKPGMSSQSAREVSRSARQFFPDAEVRLKLADPAGSTALGTFVLILIPGFEPIRIYSVDEWNDLVDAVIEADRQQQDEAARAQDYEAQAEAYEQQLQGHAEAS